MNTEEFISSGIIERHFLGFSTLEEEEDLRVAFMQFPELHVEMEEVERRIERAAIKSAVPPPEELRSKFLAIVQEHDKTFEEEKKITYLDILPPQGKMTVHIGWKIIIISLLVMTGLALLAIIIFCREFIHSS